MPPVGFEPTTSAGEQSQTYTLDRAATGTGLLSITAIKQVNKKHFKHEGYPVTAVTQDTAITLVTKSMAVITRFCAIFTIHITFKLHTKIYQMVNMPSMNSRITEATYSNPEIIHIKRDFSFPDSAVCSTNPWFGTIIWFTFNPLLYKNSISAGFRHGCNNQSTGDRHKCLETINSSPNLQKYQVLNNISTKRTYTVEIRNVED